MPLNVIMVHGDIIEGEGLFLDIPLVPGVFAVPGPKLFEVLDKGIAATVWAGWATLGISGSWNMTGVAAGCSADSPAMGLWCMIG
jgi:hypothetical protein